MADRSSYVGVSEGRAEAHSEWRAQLEELRRDRLDQLSELSRTPVAEDELAAPRIASLRSGLKEIDAALERLDDGSYGACGRCGTPIPSERLEIMPHARYCVACQRDGEHAGA